MHPTPADMTTHHPVGGENTEAGDSNCSLTSIGRKQMRGAQCSRQGWLVLSALAPTMVHSEAGRLCSPQNTVPAEQDSDGRWLFPGPLPVLWLFPAPLEALQTPGSRLQRKEGLQMRYLSPPALPGLPNFGWFVVMGDCGPLGPWRSLGGDV